VLHGCCWRGAWRCCRQSRTSGGNQSAASPRFRESWKCWRSPSRPYLILAANGPLLQAWFSREFPKASPYRLYALSNVGSLLALLSYPVLLEPGLPLRWQEYLWSGFSCCSRPRAGSARWRAFHTGPAGLTRLRSSRRWARSGAFAAEAVPPPLPAALPPPCDPPVAVVPCRARRARPVDPLRPGSRRPHAASAGLCVRAAAGDD